MTEFEPLSTALEAWFDVRLQDLPSALRRRVKDEFFPLEWEQLAPSQRRSVAAQSDSRNDPALEAERQYWGRLRVQLSELEGEIERWQAIPAPTIGDMTVKEAKLDELKRRRNALEEQFGKPFRGADSRARQAGPGAGSRSLERAGAPYVAYPIALRRLRERHEATPEELAAWIYAGPEDGGLAAYLNANELDPPPRFRYRTGEPQSLGADHDYMAPLMATWFREDELASFSPTERYITGQALIQRWAGVPGIQATAFVLAKIAESRLLDIHPVYGGTRGTFQDAEGFPPVELGLFRVSEVRSIEVEDFGGLPGAADGEPPAARRLRLIQRRDQLRGSGVRNFNQVLAQEEGCTVARIKQLLKTKEATSRQRKAATWVAPIQHEDRSTSRRGNRSR